MTQPSVPASFKTLVYSPEVMIVIEGTDVSADIVRGSVNRITGGASSLEFTLSNKNLRYNNKFRRMDRVAVWMKRINKVQVFAGYLDLVPGLQLYPSTVTFRASCTIKRLLYMYWDPALDSSLELLNQQRVPFGESANSAAATTTDADADADDAKDSKTPTDDAKDSSAPKAANPGGIGLTPPSGMTAEEWNKIMYPGYVTPSNGNPDSPSGSKSGAAAGNPNDPAAQEDTGLGNMLKEVLNKVGGWPMEQILVQEFPQSFMGYVEEQMPNIENLNSEAVEAFKKLFQFNASASTAGGSGDMGDAVFTSIGPPANGSNYSDEEIVWIVLNAGWKGEDAVIGSSIVKAESGGNPGAINTANSDGSVDRGLWQINSIHDGKLPGKNRFDPAVSTELARIIYREGGNSWNAWSTLVYHGTAQKHFATFRPIVASGGTMPPGTKLKDGSTSGGSSNVNNGGNSIGVGGTTKSSGSSSKSSSKDKDSKDASKKKTDSAGSAPLGSYGMPPGTNISYGAPGFPDWCYSLGQQFNVKPSTYAGHQESDRNEPGYEPNPRGLNRGIDWGGSVDDLQRFAEYLFGAAPNMPALEQIIWMNPNTGQKIGWYGRSPDTSGSYYADTYSGHQNHVHTRQSAALDGSASMSGSSAAGSGGDSGALAKNIFTYMFTPEGFNSELSNMLTGRYASLNDEPLIKTVRAICESGMREFMSSPNGDFLAFYPDYFGVDNTAPVLKLEDVEIKNVSISINDDALTTHVFTMGASDPSGAFADSSPLGYMSSPGTVTVEDEWLFKRATQASFFQSDAANGKELLSRFGVRPLARQYSNIWQESRPEIMLLVAVKLFMQKWAEQYQTSVSFTFMPELYPGMRIELVGHDLVVYVKSVTHNFDYENGFTTSAQVMAPMSASRSSTIAPADGSDQQFWGS